MEEEKTKINIVDYSIHCTVPTSPKKTTNRSRKEETAKSIAGPASLRKFIGSVFDSKKIYTLFSYLSLYVEGYLPYFAYLSLRFCFVLFLGYPSRLCLPSHSALSEYRSTGYGCQSCSRLAEQGKASFSLMPPFAPENWCRETDSAVPSRVSLPIPHTQAESGAYSRDNSRFPRQRFFLRLTAIGSIPSYKSMCVSMMFTTESPPAQSH